MKDLEKIVQLQRGDAVHLPTDFGEYTLIPYREITTNSVHLAFVMGDLNYENGREYPDVLVRIHSECLTGDIFRSQRCDCGQQFVVALEMIKREGRGILLYMRQEGRGIGLWNKIRAYNLQENGYDTVDANRMLGHPPDPRDYKACAQILHELGIKSKSVRLLTNNPQKIKELEEYGFCITRVPLETTPTEHNIFYLRTKRDRMGHLLERV